MIDKFYVYRLSDGTPHRVLFPEEAPSALIVDEGQRIEPIYLIEDYAYLGHSRDNVQPETLALMLGRTYEHVSDFRHVGETSADFICNCDLHVVPKLLDLVVEITKANSSELPWVLKIKEKKTGRLFVTIPDLEDWHYGKTLASWYLTSLSDMQVNVDFDYKIDRQDGK